MKHELGLHMYVHQHTLSSLGGNIHLICTQTVPRCQAAQVSAPDSPTSWQSSLLAHAQMGRSEIIPCVVSNRSYLLSFDSEMSLALRIQHQLSKVPQSPEWRQYHSGYEV